MPKCFSCNTELIWQNDYDGEDVANILIETMLKS